MLLIIELEILAQQPWEDGGGRKRGGAGGSREEGGGKERSGEEGSGSGGANLARGERRCLVKQVGAILKGLW